MRIDFYQLSRDPVERVVAILAGKVLDSGERLLVVAPDSELRDAIGVALWAADGFRANGRSDEPGADRQPVLLSDRAEAANGARIVLLADGTWRDEATRFDRALLLFGPERTGDARTLWRRFDADNNVERRIYKQDEGGRWREGA